MTSYSPAAIWLVIGAAGLGTLLIRLSMIALLGRGQSIPSGVERSLRFIPPAVLAALVAPAFVLRSGDVDLTLGNLRLVAGLVAAVVAWRTKNVLWTIVSGMVVLWILQAVT